MNEYKVIREILARWYGGDTGPEDERKLLDFFATHDELPQDPEDERKLLDFFATHDELPQDLEDEREMFLSIADAADAPVDIPEPFAGRINAAVDAEMARDRKKVGASRWRRHLLAYGSAAACLVAALIAVHFFVGNDQKPESRTETVAVNAPLPADTLIMDVPSGLAPKQEQIAKVETPKRRHKAVSRPVRKENVPKKAVDAQEVAPEEQTYLSEAEEMRLVAANYHVVTDEREADAILNSVFVRLEVGMVEGTSNISDIGSKYEMEVATLYDL